MHLHRATLIDVDVVDDGGFRYTTAARTVMDIAREHGVSAGVVAADCALRRGLVDEDALAAEYERCATWPGRKAARLTLLGADRLAESPLESLSRLCMAAHGLPKPSLQTVIRDEHGQFVGRVDFYWDEFGVVGECDGELKYSDAATVTAEKRRQIAVTDTGLIVVRWDWAAVFAFGPVARRLDTAFARGAHHGSPQRRWRVAPHDTRLHP
ncbi:hypothetical protein [uncultured Jatrophihabitans sp.]|uniref:hypothetical protein n=1 Tax=uncultured Jatrophihabitans sp. TaxID=1610747 RepID=UPI0035CA63C4